VKALQREPEELLEECRPSVLIGVRERGTAGEFVDAKGFQFLLVKVETIADFSQGFHVPQMVE